LLSFGVDGDGIGGLHARLVVGEGGTGSCGSKVVLGHRHGALLSLAGTLAEKSEAGALGMARAGKGLAQGADGLVDKRAIAVGGGVGSRSVARRGDSVAGCRWRSTGGRVFSLKLGSADLSGVVHVCIVVGGKLVRAGGGGKGICSRRNDGALLSLARALTEHSEAKTLGLASAGKGLAQGADGLVDKRAIAVRGVGRQRCVREDKKHHRVPLRKPMSQNSDLGIRMEVNKCTGRLAKTSIRRGREVERSGFEWSGVEWRKQDAEKTV
jgi:hypothetical protein